MLNEQDVEKLLGEYASWVHIDVKPRLSYPSRAAFAVMPSRACGCNIDDQTAMMIHDAMLSLQAHSPIAGEILRAHYLEPCPVTHLAARHRLCRKTVRSHIKNGVYWVYSYLVQKNSRPVLQSGPHLSSI